jgi:hypothetical protein
LLFDRDATAGLDFCCAAQINLRYFGCSKAPLDNFTADCEFNFNAAFEVQRTGA